MSLEEIKKNLASVIIGTNVVMDNLRQGKIKKIYLASNADASLKKEIEHFKIISYFEIEELNVSNDDLGTECKKPFSVSVVGVLK
ncbi:MAG: ribosomal L7Ae/L30e/S12e/Gadd45 family protein [Nanoarchaeota archaeon]|nr:ribosomal L7Ae/L30e/S12e/Gadd45 family protein [Nanoarchaeota archaeon]